MTDNAAKEKIADAIKAVEKHLEELKLLREYNFNYSVNGPQGPATAKQRLMEIGYGLVMASNEILRRAGDLEGR